MTSILKAPSKKQAKNAPGATRSTMPDGPGTVMVVKGSAPIEGLTIGGEPRVHLLPPQVLARKKGRAVRRRLGIAVVGMLILVAAGFGLAQVMSISAQSALTDAQAQTSTILQQQAKFNNVERVKSDSSSILTSQKTATTTEILWKPFVAEFQNSLPGDASITILAASLDDSAGAAPATSTDPLDQTHIATVTASVTMKQSEISGWLNTLPGITGFVDVTPNSVTKGENGIYTVATTIHIDKDALANRFSKAGTTK
jgi:hypothetical protein